jgi:hypothetical protein
MEPIRLEVFDWVDAALVAAMVSLKATNKKPEHTGWYL